MAAFDFDQYAAVLLDLDGTVYHEDHALPGAIDLIRRFQREDRPYACLTNSTSSPQRLVQRLARMGVDVDPGHVYTAAAAACDYVLDRFGERFGDGGRGRPRVFNLATEGVHEMLDGRVEWVGCTRAHAGTTAPRGPCDAVIVGTLTSVFATPERQRDALYLVRGGAALVGSCADRVYPSPRGLEFGSGALTHMIGYAANAAPFFTGKPEAVFFRKLCEKLGVEPARCVLVGDNLESDIAGAAGVGMDTVLTLTGVTALTDLEAVPPERAPRHVVADLRELL